MTKLIELHPDDDLSLVALRSQLRSLREQKQLSAGQVSRNLGRNEDFVSNLERAANRSPAVGSLQMWASGLDVRIEFGLANFWLIPHVDSQMLALYAMSRPWGADVFMRQWLVAALRAWRVRRGIDVATLAPMLNRTVDSVRAWELESNDPLIGRAMWQARHTGTAVTWQLWHKDEWVYG